MADVLALTPEEKLRLVEEVWDSLAIEPQMVELTDAQRQELDARLESARQNPHLGSSWEEVKARIRKQP
jgi:putative addiction module component (TIGR02574 family)